MKDWSPESQDVLSPGKAISSLQPDASLTWLCALLQPPPPWSRSKVRLVVPLGSPWIQPRQHAHSLPGPASRDLCSSQAHLQHDKRESDVVSAYERTHLGSPLNHQEQVSVPAIASRVARSQRDGKRWKAHGFSGISSSSNSSRARHWASWYTMHSVHKVEGTVRDHGSLA
jgi:hypothetical protein